MFSVWEHLWKNVLLSRYQISQSNGGQSNETEINGIFQRPIFQLHIKNGTQNNVRHHNTQTHNDRHRDLFSKRGCYISNRGRRSRRLPPSRKGFKSHEFVIISYQISWHVGFLTYFVSFQRYNIRFRIFLHLATGPTPSATHPAISIFQGIGHRPANVGQKYHHDRKADHCVKKDK